eukprot:scaffold3689_cov107-Skeletonema_dohrnii-CCMP3373.AAC.8
MYVRQESNDPPLALLEIVMVMERRTQDRFTSGCTHAWDLAEYAIAKNKKKITVACSWRPTMFPPLHAAQAVRAVTKSVNKVVTGGAECIEDERFS